MSATIAALMLPPLKKGLLMAQTIGLLALTSALAVSSAVAPAQAAEREQVRMVINLVAGVKKPFPE